MKYHIRQFENIHIPLWLLKDTCWMMEWKTVGIIMIVPTIIVASFLAWRTRENDEFFVNLAVLAWILSNSYWMCCEFTGHIEIKNYAGIGFALGAISVSYFYYKRLKNRKGGEVAI